MDGDVVEDVLQMSKTNGQVITLETINEDSSDLTDESEIILDSSSLLPTRLGKQQSTEFQESEVWNLCSALYKLVIMLAVGMGCLFFWYAGWTLYDILPDTENIGLFKFFCAFYFSFLVVYAEVYISDNWMIKYIHAFSLAIAQVILWESWWNILDRYTSHILVQTLELISSFILLSVTGGLASTFQFYVDPCENYKPKSSVPICSFNRSGNVMSTILIYHLPSITFWTQLWNITDKLVFPKDDYLSTIFSVIFGVLAVLTFYVINYLTLNKLSNRFVVLLIYYIRSIIGVAASVQIWRGFYMIVEKHMNSAISQLGLLKIVPLLLMAFSIFTCSHISGYSGDIADFSLDFDEHVMNSKVNFQVNNNSSLTQESKI